MPELHQSELKQRSGGTFFLEDQQKNQVLSHQCSDFAKRLDYKTLQFQSAFTYSKLTIETLDEGVKYVQS